MSCDTIAQHVVNVKSKIIKLDKKIREGIMPGTGMK
jgi:hypothetical protein